MFRVLGIYNFGEQPNIFIRNSFVKPNLEFVFGSGEELNIYKNYSLFLTKKNVKGKNIELLPRLKTWDTINTQ